MDSSNGDLVNRVAKLRLDSQLGGVSSRGSSTSWLPWTLCILLAIAWAGVGIRGYRTAPSNTEAPSIEKQTSAPVQATPAVESGSVVLEVKGYLVPARQIAVSPIDVAGRVVELNVVEGKKYEAGTILAKLEDTSYKAMVEESKAGVASAERRLEGAKARLAMLMPESVRPIEISQVAEELKEAEALRARAQDEVTRLGKLSTGTAAEREMNQAKFDLLAASARVMRLTAALAILREGPRKEQKAAVEAEIHSEEAELVAANARLTQAKWRLDNCIIRSPITGTVLTKKAELFNLANPNAFSVGVSGGASGSICEMADLSDMEVDIEIPEKDLTKLAKVKTCRIRADAFPGRVYEGTLDRIMPIAVRAKSIINVRVKLKLPPGEEPGTYLKPEMGALVTFLAN